MICRVSVLIAILFIYLAAPSMAYADRRLDIFLEKYNAAKGRLLPMAHADSPFYRYYDRDFEGGLDEPQAKLLSKAQERGDCILVDQLLLEGFLNLFPFLKPAFDDYKRRSKLSIMMSNSDPPAMGRCFNHSSMSELFAKRRREEFPPVDFVEGHTYFDKWQNETDSDLKKLRITLRGFGSTALCDDYRLSISDLMPIVNRHGGMVLTPEEELYLLERARLHNLAKRDYEKAILRLSKHFDSKKKFSKLRSASRVRKLEDIAFTVKGYWQASCRNLERLRREE